MSIVSVGALQIRPGHWRLQPSGKSAIPVMRPIVNTVIGHRSVALSGCLRSRRGWNFGAQILRYVAAALRSYAAPEGATLAHIVQPIVTAS